MLTGTPQWHAVGNATLSNDTSIDGAAAMETSQLTTHINAFGDNNILPTMLEYIRIPNESPLFDPAREAHGHMEKAVALVADLITRQHVPDASE
jgi:hypothetical protein